MAAFAMFLVPKNARSANEICEERHHKFKAV